MLKSIITASFLLVFLTSFAQTNCDSLSNYISVLMQELDSLHQERKKVLIEKGKTPNELIWEIRGKSINFSASIFLFRKVKKCSDAISMDENLMFELLMNDNKLLIHMKFLSTTPSSSPNGTNIINGTQGQGSPVPYANPKRKKLGF